MWRLKKCRNRIATISRNDITLHVIASCNAYRFFIFFFNFLIPFWVCSGPLQPTSKLTILRELDEPERCEAEFSWHLLRQAWRCPPAVPYPAVWFLLQTLAAPSCRGIYKYLDLFIFITSLLLLRIHMYLFYIFNRFHFCKFSKRYCLAQQIIISTCQYGYKIQNLFFLNSLSS